ncbi:MAG: hypothetical protein R3275_10020, partial [Saprospiraceae bacterium]|nr:hypothetical protein [Saprospiraceae bacterium]
SWDDPPLADVSVMTSPRLRHDLIAHYKAQQKRWAFFVLGREFESWDDQYRYSSCPDNSRSCTIQIVFYNVPL